MDEEDHVAVGVLHPDPPVQWNPPPRALVDNYQKISGDLRAKQRWEQKHTTLRWEKKRQWLEQNVPVCPVCGDRCSVCHSLKSGINRGVRCCLKQ